eukprot:TRINITY_DN1147_c0_g1_i1.p1 TRINITY_DN1147_c0_g1~~TRINITY_DN1147_c0_g1_i1.p1  ORF type:complete len:176 (-),score=58.56 TRINITY_DN1147_c0_g1_i1:24-551(-)
MFKLVTRSLRGNKITVSRRYSAVSKAQAIPRVSARDVFWLCRSGEHPVIIDSRPEEEFNLYHIVGSYNLPAGEVVPKDLEGFPVDRPVFVFGADDEDESNALKVANFILETKSTPSLKVSLIKGGPTEIRNNGFCYNMDTDGWKYYLQQKADAAKAAADAAKAAADAKAAAAAKK